MCGTDVNGGAQQAADAPNLSAGTQVAADSGEGARKDLAMNGGNAENTLPLQPSPSCETS